MNREAGKNMTSQKKPPKLHTDISEASMQLACSRYKKWKDLHIAWEETAYDLYMLTAARLALTFQYDEAENQLITKGVAGLPMAISKTMSFLGVGMLQRRWPLYEGVKEDLLTGELILLDSIEEVSSYNLSAYQSFYIQKILGVESVYSMGLLGSRGDLMGNFVLLLGTEPVNEKNVCDLAACAAAEIERLGFEGTKERR